MFPISVSIRELISPFLNGALAAIVVDFAHGKFVRAGHEIAREDLRDDDAFERARDFLDSLDFKTEHGELLGQLFA
jgi:hypothetical protein